MGTAKEIGSIAARWGGALVAGLLGLAAALSGVAEEGSWSETFHGPEGQFALRVDVSQRHLILLRSDQRGSPRMQLRVRFHAEAGRSWDVPLQRVETAESPWRYRARLERWEEPVRSLELEASSDGQAWKTVGTATRP